jgi:hypothetical protein
MSTSSSDVSVPGVPAFSGLSIKARKSVEEQKFILALTCISSLYRKNIFSNFKKIR